MGVVANVGMLGRLGAVLMELSYESDAESQKSNLAPGLDDFVLPAAPRDRLPPPPPGAHFSTQAAHKPETSRNKVIASSHVDTYMTWYVYTLWMLSTAIAPLTPSPTRFGHCMFLTPLYQAQLTCRLSFFAVGSLLMKAFLYGTSPQSWASDISYPYGISRSFGS